MYPVKKKYIYPCKNYIIYLRSISVKHNKNTENIRTVERLNL